MLAGPAGEMAAVGMLSRVRLDNIWLPDQTGTNSPGPGTTAV